jgi:hypothetical protein
LKQGIKQILYICCVDDTAEKTERHKGFVSKYFWIPEGQCFIVFLYIKLNVAKMAALTSQHAII